MEGIILQVPSLEPRFSIFIDLCSCYFQAVESFTVQVDIQLTPNIWFNDSVLVCSRIKLVVSLNCSI